MAAGTSLWSPAVAQSKKLTYWGGLIFSEDANKLLVDTINAWGAANGVETEVVMINQNETVQKVSAAVVVQHHAGCARSLPRPAAAHVAAGRLHHPRRSLRQDRRGAGRLVRGRRPRDRHDRNCRRSHRHSLRRQRQPAAAPQGPAGAGGLHRAAKDLGGARRPGRRGQQAAGLGPRPRAFQCRRRQSAGQRAAILRRPHRRRRRQDGDDQVRGNAHLSHLAEGRLGQGAVPARRDDLGRRRRQPGLPLRPGRLHRQHRLGRHRRQEGRSRALRSERLLAAAGRSDRHDLADQPASPRDHQDQRRTRTRPRR